MTPALSTLVASAPPITDNEVLDEYTIPFGSWTDEAVDWITLNLRWLLDAIGWPFEFLINNLVEDFLVGMPWLWLVGVMFAIAWLVRNLTVAIGTAAGLVVCGLLGNEYWEETARTIGLILVAVLLCVIIGIPLGILAGRNDAVWSTLRPTLDAMQVVHSFVYLLPFIYFWGVGAVGATMATMIFALPPLIRLTNLGIRQVPGDVVEAARAYGAPERRVLTDVQLPLARPAIMTGINQTLLLAFSMLGVAAIMGAGGLGALLFRALGQQNVALGASAGLAFFLLAVIMDRIAQTDASGSGLFARISAAWKARNQPEVLLDNPNFNPALADDEAGAEQQGEPADDHEETFESGSIAPIGANEQRAMIVAVAGSVLMIVSLFLTWANDAALLTGYSRRSDEDLAGRSFSGLAAEGGSWFGIVIGLAALVVIAAVIATRFRIGSSRWLAPDGAMPAALGGLIAAVAYLLANPSDFAENYSHGIGVYVAVIGGLVATAGAVGWMAIAPYGPRRPLKPHVVATPMVLAGTGLLVVLAALFSSWSLDQRADALITPEVQTQIDELLESARAGEIEPAVAASEIQVIRARAEAADSVIIDGKSSEGAGLGTWALVAAIAGAAASLVAAGAAGLGERRQWLGGAFATGFGTGVMLISIGWIGSLARATDNNFQSGVGSFIALLGGVAIAAGGARITTGFVRSKIYAALTIDQPSSPNDAAADGSSPADEELTATVAR